MVGKFSGNGQYHDPKDFLVVKLLYITSDMRGANFEMVHNNVERATASQTSHAQ